MWRQTNLCKLTTLQKPNCPSQASEPKVIELNTYYRFMDKTRPECHVEKNLATEIAKSKKSREMAFCQVVVRVTLVAGTGRGNNPRPLFNRPTTLLTTPISQA